MQAGLPVSGSVLMPCLVFRTTGTDSTRDRIEVFLFPFGTNRADSAYSGYRPKEDDDMDTTTLLILIIVILLVFGGGWYGRGRWY